MTRLFQIYVDDLEKLESLLPKIMDECFEKCNDTRVRMYFREIKRIMSDVRWNYGPPLQVEKEESSQ